MIKDLRDKEVVMVTYAYPPYRAIGSIRSDNISKQFLKHFKSVIILTTDNVTKSIDVNRENLNVKRLWTLDYDKLRRVINIGNRKKIRSKSNESLSSDISFFSKMVNSFPFNLIFGLGGLMYILSGIFYGLFQLKKKDIILFSSFSPLSDHIIAFFIKIFKPKAYWIADYRDVIIMPDSPSVLFPKLEIFIHKQIMKKANVVAVVSEGHKNYFKKYAVKAVVLRNSTNLNDKLDTQEILPSNSIFRITYTGRLYKDKRNPSLMFKAIEDLISQNKIDRNLIEVVYAGPESGYWLKKANNFSFKTIDMGMISREEAIKTQLSSHILLMMNWNLPGLLGGLSGKLFEYFESNRYILAIIKGERDPELEEIFNNVKAGTVVYDHIDNGVKIKKFIYEKYASWLNGDFNHSPIARKDLERYSWDSVFKIFIEEAIN